MPEDAAYTREEILAAILEAQEPDGGFGLTAGASDVDITAMAVSYTHLLRRGFRLGLQRQRPISQLRLWGIRAV